MPTSSSDSLVLLCTHLVVGGRRREQRNRNNHGSREAAQQYGEVEVVDAAEHGGGRVFNAASGQREGELQHHPAHAHHQTHHQAPEGSLGTHNPRPEFITFLCGTVKF